MGEWKIETSASEVDIRRLLGDFEPWRTKIVFNDSISTEEYKTIEPFSRTPLNKIALAEKSIPAGILGGRVLDVGCNNGYNSIYLASRYGARATGFDFNARHPAVARKLAELAGVAANFTTGDAETFSRPGEFDLVVHYGTLYHLVNPLASLQRCAENLRPGGWLTLETTAYIAGAHPHENMFFWNYNNDQTNWWALSKATIEQMLQLLGFAPPTLVFESHPKIYAGKYSRVLYVAERT